MSDEVTEIVRDGLRQKLGRLETSLARARRKVDEAERDVSMYEAEVADINRKLDRLNELG